MQIFAEQVEEPAIHKTLPQRVKEHLIKNDIIIFTVATYGFAILSAPLLIGSLAPAPFSPLTTIPNWASWFDIWITFPALSILCLIPFRGTSRETKATMVCLVAVIPLYLIFASYYFAYALIPFGFAIFGTSLTLLVPAAALVILLATPALNSIIISRNIPRSVVPYAKANFYFIVAAAASLSLAVLQTAIRVAYDGTQPLTAWVSDIGVGVQAAGTDILHGIDPYVVGVPPWGGHAPLTWGPLSVLMTSPFSFAGPGWGAHISALAYSCIASFGIWKCMKILSSNFALRCALLFLALPTTSWLIESGTALHAIGTLFIVWTFYFYLTKSYLKAGIFCSLGMIAMLIPAALIVPFIFYAKQRKARTKLALGFLIPSILFVSGLFVAFSPKYVGELMSSGVLSKIPVGFSLNLLFTPIANEVLRYVLTGWLVFWFIYKSSRIQNDADLVTTTAIFFLLLPFATGFYLAFFFVWGSALGIMAVFSQMNTNGRMSLIDNAKKDLIGQPIVHLVDPRPPSPDVS